MFGASRVKKHIKLGKLLAVLALLMIPTIAGASIIFDGTTEKVEIPSDSRLTWTPVTQARTLHLLYRVDTLITTNAKAHQFLFGGQTSGNKFGFRFIKDSTAGNILECLLINSSWTVIGRFYCSFTPTQNVFHSIAFVASSNNNCKIYVDGVAKSLTYSSWDDTTQIAPDEYHVIQDDANIQGSYAMAHWSWWGRELTVGEINSIRNTPDWASGGTNLLLWYKMDEGSGTNVNDYSGTPLDATLTDATWAPQPLLFAYSSANPLIIDNDDPADTYTDEYACALAAAGAINLKGLITSSSYTTFNHYITGTDFDNWLTDRAGIKTKALEIGWTGIPTPVSGVKGNLTKPGSEVIEDTTPANSAGGQLIVTEANNASVSVPLVVCVGGSLGSVADAYLLDNTIVNKVIVLAIVGNSSGTGMNDFNAWLDPWAAYIVLKKFKMIAFRTIPSNAPAVTKAQISSDLPDSSLKTWMYDKTIPAGQTDRDADCPPVISIMEPGYVLNGKQVAFTEWTTLTYDTNTHDAPMFGFDTAGTTMVVNAVDVSKATTEWWRAMGAADWSPSASAVSVCASGCGKATPQAAFNDYDLTDGATVTINGDYSLATLDLSAAGETGTIYITGAFKLGKLIGKSGLSLVGRNAVVTGPIEFGNNAKLLSTQIVH